MKANTNTSELKQILSTMKKQQYAKGIASAELRKDRLQRSIALIKENHNALTQAMSDDFGHRSHYHTGAADLMITCNILQNAIDNVDQWMKPEITESPDPAMQTSIHYQPVGVVGVISPWNFPINLAFGPIAGVFAAGNSAMLKPSELTPKTSLLLAELVGRYFGPEELTVVLGDADVGQAFSALAFDHLVFTGSTSVGKHVMRAAAENLVPVTLELGGKSPVMVAKDADLNKVVERTLTVKVFNSGQICISPDYMLLAHESVSELTSKAKQAIANMLPTLIDNPDYTSIINERHFQRLIGLMEDAKEKGARLINLAPEGEPAYDEERRIIAPHLVLDVTEDMAIMQEEIFGPLLPIRTYESEAEAIEYINSHPRPLAAYYFSENTAQQTSFANQTISGGLVINDVMTHVSVDSLPFGGVGPSGMGAYHGIHGFREFSHAKPIVIQSEEALSSQRLRAPYKDKQTALDAFFNS